MIIAQNYNTSKKQSNYFSLLAQTSASVTNKIFTIEPNKIGFTRRDRKAIKLHLLATDADSEPRSLFLLVLHLL
jgi:hypothetical protein